VESRWGDDRLMALAELPFCFPKPGAGVGSTEFRPTAVTIWEVGRAITTARATIRLRHGVDDGEIFYLNGERIHGFGQPEGLFSARMSCADLAGPDTVIP
jgi:hypothetical protein